MKTEIKKTPHPKQTIFLARIIWATLFFSLVNLSFVLVQTVSTQNDTVQNLNLNDTFNLTLILAAAISFVLTLILPQRIRKVRDSQKVIRGFGPFIVRLLLAEFVGLLGFVLASRIADPNVFYPFLGASALLFLMSFPRQELLESLGVTSR